MKAILSTFVSLLILILTTGCWDNSELDEYGFVQAVAIDLAEDNLIHLTTHFYNPSSKMEMGEAKAGQKGINITTIGETIFEATRDIPTKFGRKAKWDHMRVILLGEKLAKTQNIGEVLDYFSRDHEPRGTILPLVTQGTASEFLEIKPFIEQTIGQQYKKMETNGAVYSGKTSNVPLYELAIGLKSPSKIAAIPYVHKGDSKDEAMVSGIAIIKNGKLAEILKDKDPEAFMVLTNKYQSGIINFNCIGSTEGQTQIQESFEVLSLDSNKTVKVEGNEVTVRIKVHIEGTVGELRCSVLKTKEDVQRFQNKVSERSEEGLQHAITLFKQRKLDAIGVGNQIYRQNPKLWKKLEQNWDKIFAQSRFEVEVEVKVLSVGLSVGTPFGLKEK
ncbi:Ger(x)C family spore germination protein [Cohnella abietis]|uniref:Uncharacterized protein n=1 Tax=Cohnella abietis TaxID=2507935 RepID=A0A3T1D7K2_9BACL|nr:Ger(x)C family spore germination protein [Cohnella abietis]BBI34066.1 hypothetical protein KCTCHS21_34650 [Cohnella abietis]